MIIQNYFYSTFKAHFYLFGQIIYYTWSNTKNGFMWMWPETQNLKNKNKNNS